jgi:hypothetical protein
MLVYQRVCGCHVLSKHRSNTTQTGLILPVKLKKGVEATNLDELEFSRDDSDQYSFAKRSQ